MTTIILFIVTILSLLLFLYYNKKKELYYVFHSCLWFVVAFAALCFTILSAIYDLDMVKPTRIKQPEYTIELLNQEAVIISNGQITDTIILESIPEWIEQDNL